MMYWIGAYVVGFAATMGFLGGFAGDNLDGEVAWIVSLFWPAAVPCLLVGAAMAVVGACLRRLVSWVLSLTV